MPTKDNKEKKLDYGHRQRLREYIIKNFDTASKEKIFEYLMCMAIPMKDTRILSKSILEKVGGSLVNLFNKNYDYLKNSLNLTDSVIASILTVSKIMSLCNTEELLDEIKFDSRNKIIKYFQKEIGFKETEYIMVLFLNSAQKLIEKKIFGDKNSSITSFNIADMIAVALNNNTKFLVLSHNHPSGNVSPSQADKETTGSFEDTIKHINKFELIDHIIVSREKYYSFFEHNLLKNNKYIK
ncbi:MAG TPA: JAB domain-containing protein [Rickettsiales bacterium]|nr:JAB domain-containing protein [Rickettsiales bacterium]